MMGFWISIAMFGLIGLMQIFIPYMLKRTIIFGVTIPASFIHHHVVKQTKKIYSIAMFIIWLILLISYSIWALHINYNENLQVVVGIGTILFFILISLLFYAYFHYKLQKEKRQEQWGADLTEVKIASTSLSGQDGMLPLSYFISLVFVSLILIIYTYYQYPILPEQIPTHWGPNGKPDAFTEKNRFSIISLPLVMLVMQAMFVAISEGTKRSGIKISAFNMQRSAFNQIKKRKYTSWFMFLTAFLITILFSFLQLTTIHHDIIGQNIMLAMFITFIAVIFVGSIIFTFKVSRLEKEGYSSNLKEGIMDIDDDRYWKGGLMYFNKEDPSLFVEKRFGIGWTINFARPMSYVILFGPLLLILLIAYFS